MINIITILYSYFFCLEVYNGYIPINKIKFLNARMRFFSGSWI